MLRKEYEGMAKKSLEKNRKVWLDPRSRPNYKGLAMPY